MSVMSGAWVSRARLHATEGAPMPTKHTSSFFSTRAAAMAIIAAVEYSMVLFQVLLLASLATRLGVKDLLLHPVKKCLAVPSNPIPGNIKCAVARVIAMSV